MNAPFKLKSGNNPDKKGFFGTIKNRLTAKAKSILNIESKEDALKVLGYSDKDVKGEK